MNKSFSRNIVFLTARCVSHVLEVTFRFVRFLTIVGFLYFSWQLLSIWSKLIIIVHKSWCVYIYANQFMIDSHLIPRLIKLIEFEDSIIFYLAVMEWILSVLFFKAALTRTARINKKFNATIDFFRQISLELSRVKLTEFLPHHHHTAAP